MRVLLISFITAAPDVLVGPGFWCGMWLWCYVAGMRMSTSRVSHLCVLRYRLWIYVVGNYVYSLLSQIECLLT
jgi:hypothetical protein